MEVNSFLFLLINDFIFFKLPNCGVIKFLPLISTTPPVTGLSEENKVQTPAFTDAVRLYRQAQGHYGTWEMMCGVPSQVSMAAQISCFYFSELE